MFSVQSSLALNMRYRANRLKGLTEKAKGGAVGSLSQIVLTRWRAHHTFLTSWVFLLRWLEAQRLTMMVDLVWRDFVPFWVFYVWCYSNELWPSSSRGNRVDRRQKCDMNRRKSRRRDQWRSEVQGETETEEFTSEQKNKLKLRKDLKMES